MTPTQREAALRLIDEKPTSMNDVLFLWGWAGYAQDLLRELLAERERITTDCAGLRLALNRAESRIQELLVATQGAPVGLDAVTAPLYTHPPQQRKPLRRGVNGVCSRSTCLCERDGLGDECIWLRAHDIGEAP